MGEVGYSVACLLACVVCRRHVWLGIGLSKYGLICRSSIWQGGLGQFLQALRAVSPVYRVTGFGRGKQTCVTKPSASRPNTQRPGSKDVFRHKELVISTRMHTILECRFALVKLCRLLIHKLPHLSRDCLAQARAPPGVGLWNG